MTSSEYAQSRRPFGIAIGGFGVILGILITLGFLNGDALGRVNLLYLLILFAFLPALSLLLAPALLFTNARVSLIGLLSEWNGWPRRWRANLAPSMPAKAARYRSFFLSQCLSIGAGLGSIFAFLLLLLVSDLSFVWRSTLLEAQQLLPLLNLIATPWAFWAEAQPSLALLQASQEYRLQTQLDQPQLLGAWWRYALASQIVYNLLPRTFMLAFAVVLQRRAGVKRESRPSLENRSREPRANPNVTIAETCSTLAQPYNLIDWAELPPAVSAALEARLGTPREKCSANPLSTSAEAAFDDASVSCVVVVKSWEPPLGELGDFLRELWHSSGGGEDGQRLLLPLDWNGAQIIPASAKHIHEWRRFAAAIRGVKVLDLNVGIRE